MFSRRRLLGSLACAGLLACRRDTPPSPPPSTGASRLIRANIYTNDPANPRAEALLIRGPEILALGSFAELESRGPAELLDWRDATILPGLTDAHAHLLGLGQTAEIVDLRGAASVDEILTRLREQAPPEGWILGRGWDQNLWGGAMPTAAQLDAAFPERPVWLRRVDGHAGWANSVVMKLTAIDASTANPEGGEILRDPAADEAATGVLVDTAMDLVPVPEPSAADIERWLIAATKQAAALGLTGVHEMGLGPTAHAVLTKLGQAGGLPIRVHGYASEGWWTAGLDGLARAPLSPSDRYTLAGVKLYVDGALGSRGAALIQPYADRPEHRGALMHEPADFVELARGIVERGFQVASHAIGDLGNRTIIDAYAQVLAAVGDAQPDPRLRVEHVQIIDPADIPRMAALGLVASMQPTHATSDMPWVEARVGKDRLAGAYAWQRMLAAGVPLAFGSDFPVERPSPLLGLRAAVTRQDRDGQPEGGWLPDQRVSMAEAVAGFSSGAAYAAQRDDHLGVLAPGYRADLTCLNGDPFRVDPSELPDLEVRATLVDGELG
ncbi:N-substituted formamide deformylase precursor [Enhygromyxa salina]|uniref:N-substituted formamide deformylase n=1 Tax=Enhygromyxa salina TaxID=215803 RepID=A0A2S9YF62_9BACT|nr:amidohydrolase [Enhygromyxa salina]PRQ03671.1 N-substituted formamide deformylase precursor [Enhygromyxa salina]